MMSRSGCCVRGTGWRRTWPPADPSPPRPPETGPPSRPGAGPASAPGAGPASAPGAGPASAPEAGPASAEPGRRAATTRPGPGFTFAQADEDGPPGGYGSWRFTTGIRGQPALLVAIDPIAIDTCDHRFEANGHDPGVKLRHLSQIRHATCTSPVCRRPAAQCDFEHNVPYEAGGRTCLCNGGPKCRHDHRLKQDPRWKVDQLPDGTFRWTTPSGRTYTTEPTSYPV